MIKVVLGNITHREEVILDPATTLRAALDEKGIDYAAGSPTLDGLTLKPGDLDKTFADMGVAEKCYLLVATKLENAAKVLVLGSAVVIRSAIKLDTIKEIAEFDPDRLTRFDYIDGHDVPIFAIGVAKNGGGSLSEYGAAFSANGSADGEGVITLTIPDGVEDRKAYIAKQYGKALMLLNTMEQAIQNAWDTEVKAEIAKIQSSIEIL